MTLAAGARFGTYEVIGLLGAGGMGEVYRARDTRLNRDVALKVLPDRFAIDADRLARFRREAQVLATLNHPNIGQIYGFEDTGTLCALVLEFVDGPTLADRLAAGPMPVDDALAVARQVAAALEASHERGIVHRDLKPANIKVRADGTVKVLDFGLAKLAAPADDGWTDAARSPTLTAGTEIGVILGTAAYMAPEQAKGQSVDKRADIWAFGAVLYEMLSGRQIFSGDSTAELLASLVRDAPDWTHMPDGTPSGVRRLLARCLEKDPKRRLRDIGDALFEIDTSLDKERVDVAATRRTAGRIVPVWTLPVAILIAAAAGAIAWRTFAPGSLPDSGATRRAAIHVTGLGDIGSSSASLITLSADGSLLVYGTPMRSSEGNLQVRRLDGLDSQPIEGTAGAQAAFLSPDGRLVGFERQGEILSIPVAGGPITRARGSAHLQEGRPAWMPDGRIVFTTPNGGLTVMRADGSATEAVTAPESGARHLSPHVLPDGRTILFTVVGQDVNASHIAVVSLGDRRVRTIVPDGAMTPQYAEGHLLYVRPDRRLMAVAFDPSSATTSGDAVALPDLVSRTRFGVAHYAAVGGLVVYVPPAVGHLVEVERSGRRERLIAEDRNYHHPRYSPDGTRLVFDLTLGGTERDVWIFDRGTRTMSRVTRIGDAHDPSWLPNGREVSFFSFKAGSLMTAPYDGATAPRPVTIGPGFAATDLLNPGSWVPDGSAYVGGVTERGAPSDVWRIPRDGSAPVKLVGSPADEVAPAISPDGRWLAYQSDETGRAEVYVRAIDGREGRVQVSNAGGTGPLWDPRGSTVFYVEPDRDRRLLVAATLSTAGSPAVASRTLVIADLNLEESDNHPNYDVHPDGSRFVVQELEPSAKLIAVFDWVRSVTRR